MIPRKIHYVWLGQSMPNRLIKSLKSWKEPLNNYEILKWDETNIRKYLSNSFVKKAFKEKKYAFVSDYVRLRVLYEYGGIYLDTDIVVRKNFDSFLESKTFWGRMYSNAVGAGIIGSEPQNLLIKKLINEYEKGTVSMEESNNKLITRFFLNNFSDFSVKNKKQVLGDENLLLPTYYFYLPELLKSRYQYASHLFVNSWTNSKRHSYLITVLPSWITSIIRNKNGKKRFYESIDYGKERD
ncbi:glycosyltransferase family 32 protein [Pediococcus parvulus]|uniref:glycosyltransferase family 32 protein n=1 Tax=Pediococcus parvulus TaxID=54062 RepID=UPI00345E3C1C